MTANVPDSAPKVSMRRERVQVWETEGIRAMDRPNPLTRYFMAIVAWAEKLNLRYAKLGNPWVYDNATFPWVATLEGSWRSIRAELDRILPRKEDLPAVQDITADAVSITQDAGWKTFILIAYGVKSKPNIRVCPDTWRAVQQIPGLRTAMFSIFEAGKRLPPHRGPYNGVLRAHLGLIVPEPSERAAIRIEQQVCHWQEGRLLIFDDAYEHESWNETPSTRVVLFIDFVKPLKFPANLLNRLLLRLAIMTPFVREAEENLRNWELHYHTATGGEADGPLV
jgi:ornithine lipid ester-linked acyl 2-hydroxylase